MVRDRENRAAGERRPSDGTPHTLNTESFEPPDVLLQLGLPGSPEIIVLNAIVAIVVGAFTYRDASRRPGVNATLWALVVAAASLLLNLLGFVIVYLVYYLLVIRS